MKSASINNEIGSFKEGKLLVSSFGFTNDVNVKNKVFIEYFFALPAELKKIILENFSPKELFEFIKSDNFTEYNQLAIEAYSVAYGNIAIFAKGSSSTDPDFTCTNHEILFTRVESSISFIDIFKKHIKNLKIDFRSFQGNELFDFLHAVTENCAKTLTRLEIRNIYSLELDEIRKMSFPNVEELKFFSCYFRDQVLDFRQVFSKVRRLAVTLTEFVRRDWVETNFPGLTHLQIDMDHHQFTQQEILKILENNPGINSLSVVECTPSLLQVINERFPNIVNLGVIGLSREFKENTEIVHMDHVKRFLYTEVSGFEVPVFITFENLKELQWYSLSKADLILMGFIAKHKEQIETLKIEDTVILDGHLAQMNNMTKLERLSFRFDSRKNATMTANGLLDFIKFNENIAEVRLYEAKQNLRQDLYETFNATKTPGWLQTFNPNSNESGNVQFIKNTQLTPKWNNFMQFLRHNFF